MTQLDHRNQTGSASAAMLRRFVLLAPLLLPLTARAEADPAQALDFVRQSGNELATAVGGAASVADKQERLARFLARVVDEDGIARFCLGRYWNAASPAQRTEYTRLFRQVLVRGVATRLGDYQTGSVKISYRAPVARADGIYVPTIVERAGNKPVNVVWMVTGEGADMRIADVVAEGMSMRLTQRGDYSSYLSRNGGDVDKLIAGIRAQLAQPIE
jgi:phospholipid transport system substrate-binding protein